MKNRSHFCLTSETDSCSELARKIGGVRVVEAKRDAFGDGNCLSIAGTCCSADRKALLPGPDPWIDDSTKSDNSARFAERMEYGELFA